MRKRRQYTDDLIGDGQGPLIINQQSEKKSVLPIITFIVIASAVGGYVYLNYFNKSDEPKGGVANQVNHPQTPPQQTKVTQQPTSQPLQQPTQPPQAVQQTQQIQQSAGNGVATTAMEKSISTAAKATGTKKLTPEEMAQIAKLVAQELAKVQQQKGANSAPKNSEDADLIKSLEAVDETLDAKTPELANIDKKAPETKAQKEVKEILERDTFNKVIVTNKKGGEDEFAKLTQEIDAILETEEVKKKEKSLAYKKELDQEAKRREKSLRFIVVRPGDTLSSIARRAYGRASAYKKIYEANPELLQNPNKISVGMKLRVPVDEEYVGR